MMDGHSMNGTEGVAEGVEPFNLGKSFRPAEKEGFYMLIRQNECRLGS